MSNCKSCKCAQRLRLCMSRAVRQKGENGAAVKRKALVPLASSASAQRTAAAAVRRMYNIDILRVNYSALLWQDSVAVSTH